MVNTFLTTSDYKESAQSLDPARLRKQRVEAYQIRNICLDLQVVGILLGLPMPEDREKHRQWIRDVKRRYDSHDSVFVLRSVNLKSGALIEVCHEVSREIKLPKKVKGVWPKNLKFPVDCNGFLFRSTDRIITLGYCYHPANQMWLGYEDSLGLYINAHIDEHIRRGYKNTMIRYEGIPDNCPRPKWVDDPTLHLNHRQTLIEREIEREEKLWYQEKPSFQNLERWPGFVWPIE